MSKTPSINSVLHRIDFKTYLNKSERNIQRVSNRLDDYLKDPNEERIHDIRTSVRRLRASYQTLPKTVQNKKKIKEFVSKSKDLFSINSKVRDCDIIFEILSKYTSVESSPKVGQQSHSLETISKLFRTLKSLRNRKLSGAKTIALELRKLNVPRFRDYKTDISEKKVQKRFNNVVSKLANTIEKNYPIVLSSPERITELHEMRKDCKKLRYLLELLPIGKNDRNKNKVVQLMEELEKIQDMLGTIHDYDTSIAYLKNRNRGRSIYGIIEHLYEERQKKFDGFVDYCKADLSNATNNLFLNIMNVN